MSDPFAALSETIRQARLAQAFVEQATALLDPANDAVTFCCMNPPYLGLFEMTLPRSVWEPQLRAQVAEAQAVIDAATGVAQNTSIAMEATSAAG